MCVLSAICTQVEHETFGCDPQCSTSHRYGQVSFDMMNRHILSASRIAKLLVFYIARMEKGKTLNNCFSYIYITPNGVLELVNELVS